MILIGITGKAGSGKDTVADYLVQLHAFAKMSCAGPLKAGLAAMGLPEPVNRDDKEKRIDGFDFTWREAAQKLGTDWGRGLDQEIWLKMLKRQILAGPDRGFATSEKRIVISDIRFENEASMIRELGGTIIHLHGRQADLGANTGHASEAGIGMEDGDMGIFNVGTMQELYEQVEQCLGAIRARP